MEASGNEPNCSICYTVIVGQDVIEPQCKSRFHKNHLAAWLLTNTSCPVCRLDLNEEIRIDLKPKTREELKNLQGIRNDFSEYFVKFGQTNVASWNIHGENFRNLLYFFSFFFSALLWIGKSIITSDINSDVTGLWTNIVIFSSFVGIILFGFFLYFILENISLKPKQWEQRSIFQAFLAILPFIIGIEG